MCRVAARPQRFTKRAKNKHKNATIERWRSRRANKVNREVWSKLHQPDGRSGGTTTFAAVDGWRAELARREVAAGVALQAARVDAVRARPRAAIFAGGSRRHARVTEARFAIYSFRIIPLPPYFNSLSLAPIVS